MNKANLRAYLIAALCLIASAGFTQAQIESAGPGEAAKTESNEIELAKHRMMQRMIKKWRQLKPGMTEKQVWKILGKPRLMQSGSHECVWFYQYLPVFNTKPNFKFREGGKELWVKDRYGAVVEKIGISDVGGIADGIVFFEAKSLDFLIAEEKAKRDEAIAKAKVNRDDAVAKQEKARERNREARRDNPRIINKEEIRDNTVRGIERRYSAAVKKIEDNYSRQIKNLSEGHNPRSPVFALRFFNQPDWNRFEELLANKEARRVKPEKPIDKWKEPKRWRELLKINMPVQKVHALLGEPERAEISVQGRREYYGDVSGHGKLFFSVGSDGEECLDSWIEPFWPAVEKSLHVENEIRRKAKRRVGD